MKIVRKIQQILTHRWAKRGGFVLLCVFVGLNVIAFLHAYKFTHFAPAFSQKTQTPDALSPIQKVKTLLTGVTIPRPQSATTPQCEYEVIHIKATKTIECWRIQQAHAKGTVALFHGYGGEKSGMLDKAMCLREMGYNVLLVDFMGAGGSEGNQCTIGYFEAEQVAACFAYLQKQGESPIYLMGTSMGAVAIMKAVSEHNVAPQGIIIECPFGSMYETVCARFHIMHAPVFPMAGLLVFWGGVQNGFWAFGHNPTHYAKNIHCPTLLLYGAKDEKVSLDEIEAIYAHLPAPKQRIIYPNAGHENYLHKYKTEWIRDVQQFLDRK